MNSKCCAKECKRKTIIIIDGKAYCVEHATKIQFGIK